jgi:threonine dehydratase
MQPTIDRAAIAACWPGIVPHVRRTPVLDAGLVGVAHISLKLEHLQHAGSFKARGAFANLTMREVPRAGVVAASGGNHGAAVAYAAQILGVPAKIFVPQISSPAKVERIRSYGADLVVGGAAYADALAASETWAETPAHFACTRSISVKRCLVQERLALKSKSKSPVSTL